MLKDANEITIESVGGITGSLTNYIYILTILYRYASMLTYQSNETFGLYLVYLRIYAKTAMFASRLPINSVLGIFNNPLIRISSLSCPQCGSAVVAIA
jgi:hypothetical protein